MGECWLSVSFYFYCAYVYKIDTLFIYVFTFFWFGIERTELWTKWSISINVEYRSGSALRSGICGYEVKSKIADRHIKTQPSDHFIELLYSNIILHQRKIETHSDRWHYRFELCFYLYFSIASQSVWKNKAKNVIHTIRCVKEVRDNDILSLFMHSFAVLAVIELLIMSFRSAFPSYGLYHMQCCPLSDTSCSFLKKKSVLLIVLVICRFWYAESQAMQNVQSSLYSRSSSLLYFK